MDCKQLIVTIIVQGARVSLSPPKNAFQNKMTLIKVIGNEKTSLKIISAKTETTKNKLRTGAKYEIILIKVVENEKQV